MSKVEELFSLANPLAESLGLEIWGIDIIGGNKPLLRIFVESSKLPNENDHEFNSQDGVNIDECAHLSRLVAINIEAENLFPTAYILEVSSPGLERAFFKVEQLLAYIGSELELSLEEPNTRFARRRRFNGTIKSVNLEQKSFSLGIEDDEEVELDWSNIKRAKLVYSFPENNKKVLNQKIK